MTEGDKYTFGSATIFSPVPGTRQTLTLAYPHLASWILETSRLSSQSETRFSLSSFQGLLIVSTCLSMDVLSSKSRLWEVWARLGIHVSVCGFKTGCPLGCHEPSGRSLSGATVSPPRTSESRDRLLERTNTAELRRSPPIHRSHDVDLKHLSHWSWITRNRFCGLDSHTNNSTAINSYCRCRYVRTLLLNTRNVCLSEWRPMRWRERFTQCKLSLPSLSSLDFSLSWVKFGFQKINPGCKHSL